MNGLAHTRIMRAAFDSLPENLRSAWKPFPDVIDVAGNYPDLFDNPSASEEAKRTVDPDWERFCRFPETMEARSLHTWPHTIENQPAWQPVILHWLREAITSCRAGDTPSFIKWIGCLSHHEGDVTQPAHVLGLVSGMKLMEELLPKPPHLPNFNYHSDLEAVTGQVQLPLPPPRLLGTTAEEVAWRLCALNTSAVKEMKRYVVPTLQAIFSGNEAEAERLAGPPVTLAARLTQDILYTALRLARADTPTEEREALQTLDLRLWPAMEEKHDLVYGGHAVLDGSLRIPPYPGPRVPAVLHTAEGTRPVPALGVLPCSDLTGAREVWMRYDLPPGVFSRFQALVGLHAELGAEGRVEFVVELDGTEAWSSETRCGTDEALPVEVLLGKARSMRLLVRDRSEGCSFWQNHALWASPRLVKDEKPTSQEAQSDAAPGSPTSKISLSL